MEKVEWAKTEEDEKYSTPSFFDERLKKLWEQCKESQKILEDLIQEDKENKKGLYK